MLIPTDPAKMFRNLLKALVEPKSSLKPEYVFILKIGSLYS